MTGRAGLVLMLVMVMLAVFSGGCAIHDRGIKKFAPPAADVMPRRVLIVKRGETDLDLNGYIDGVLVEVYLFNNDRTDEGADQPFHRTGSLAFKVFGPNAEVMCEGEFNAATLSDAQATGFFGPGYGLQIHFAARGYVDVRDRAGARMDFEFTPTGDPTSRAFGSTQVRLGPVF